MSSSPSLSLSEPIDLGKLQSIRDSFARAAGISSVILSPEGEPLTKFADPTGFCTLIQSTGKGRERCLQSFVGMRDNALGLEVRDILLLCTRRASRCADHDR
ncbi:MAG: hypothetical protein C4B59_16665 [Candidatus Methanogaster sp.]|uniref:Uncharacterized protein n=1 Tax=Candidatus Methanogaster sp. TaxID=3386292 RepID=A0AC61KYA3_9EURY|nr:MAG: hypothetical protein C4B59_16665 [ANME-2 cluster archaeon]